MKRYSTSLLYLCVLLCFSASTQAVPSPDQTACQKINEWLVENSADLPRSYERISQLPMPYRRAIFSVLTSEEQSELLKAHLENYLEEHKTLTDGQRNLVQQAIEITSPEFFRTLRLQGRQADEARRTLKDFQIRALHEFDKDAAREAFAQVGPSGLEVVMTGLLVKAGSVSCECNVSHEFCPSGFACYQNPTSLCITRTSGCGWLLAQACNGICTRP